MLRKSSYYIIPIIMKSRASSSISMQAAILSTSPPNYSPAAHGGNGNTPQPPSIEFPTSPQGCTSIGSDAAVLVTHYSHPKHPLAQLTLPELFACAGCKEYGAGKRFACQECDYQLHEFCALSPPLLRSHPLHPQHQLVFHSRPKQGGIKWPRCDICGKSCRGFTFRCRACSFQMHPCCAMLSTDITLPELHPHPLKLLPPRQLQLSNAGESLVSCDRCKKRRSGGRVYRCAVCNNYHLHALCAKPFINGLQENGFQTAPDHDKPSNTVLGTAARLASQVVIEFIGGLIEGFGEGFGQALVQSINPRGRPRRRSPTRPSAEATTAPASN